MIPTEQIRDALQCELTASGLFEKVIPFSTADLSAALEHLRDSPDSLSVIVPSRDAWDHETDEDNLPLRSEVRNDFELLVTARDLDMREDGVPDCVQIKDQICARLMWSNLSIPHLLCLPLTAEPLVIEIDHRRGREAWKITLETRYKIFS